MPPRDLTHIRHGTGFPPRALQDAKAKFKNAMKDFESCLNARQKAGLQALQISDPDSLAADLAAFMNELDGKYRGQSGTNWGFKHRLRSVVKTVLQFSGVIDTVIGGAQNLIASSVWGAMKLMLQVLCNKHEVLDQLSKLWLRIGQVFLEYGDYQKIYKHSESLKVVACEFLTAVVELCHKGIRTSQTITVRLLKFDALFGEDERALILKLKRIKARADLEMKQQVKDFTQTGKQTYQTGKQTNQTVKQTNQIVKQTNQRVKQANQTVSFLRSDRMRAAARASVRAFLSACSDYDPEPTLRWLQDQGTSNWVERLPIYADWQNTAGSQILWIYGKLGSGKSVIAATLVESLVQQPTKPQVAYFFCRYNNEPSLKARAIYGTLAKQLLSKHLSPTRKPELEESAYLDDSQILGSIQQFLPNSQQGYYLVVDGLDECPTREVDKLLDWLTRLLAIGNTFRIYLSVRAPMLDWAKRGLPPHFTAYISSEERPEIRQYVETEISARLKKGLIHVGNRAMTEKIVEALIEKCDGMFLWLYLQLEILRKLNTDREILHHLQNLLPGNLKGTFDRIVRDLSQEGYPDHAQFCKKAFGIVASAKRPLTMDELPDAMSVRLGDRDLNDEDLINDMPKALEQFGSLLVLDEVLLTVQFAHQSVREYVLTPSNDELLARYRIDPRGSETEFAGICATYLSFRRFGLQVDKISEEVPIKHTAYKAPQPMRIPEKALLDACASSKSVIGKSFVRAVQHINKRKPDATLPTLPAFSASTDDTNLSDDNPERSYPFLDYAKDYWLSHSRDFHEDDGGYYSWLALLEGNVKSVVLPWAPERWNHLQPKFVNWAFDHDHSALLSLIFKDAASQPGLSCFEQPAILKRLREKLPCAESAPSYFALALQIAILGRNWEITRLLLRTDGMDVNASGGFFGNVLQTASRASAELGDEHRALIKELLESGANVNLMGGYHGCALQAAAERGILWLVQELLAAGADVNLRGGRNGTALQAAAMKGHKEVVRFLVGSGADVNAIGGQDGGALQAAAHHGHDDVLLYLLDHGANINAVYGKHGTALNAAISYHSKGVKPMELARLLIERGAIITLQGGELGGALQTAAAENDLAMVDFLLERGAVCTASAESGSALDYAAAVGNVTMVERLIAHEADVNGQSNTGNPLYSAAHKGKESTARVLISNGGQVNRADSRGQPLRGAAEGGHMSMVELLLDHGADVNAADIYSGGWGSSLLDGTTFVTAIQAAALRGHEQVVRLLITKGADINKQGGIFLHNAIFAAVSGGHERIIRLLLEQGAQIRFRGKDGDIYNALDEGKYQQREEIVQLLLDWEAVNGKKEPL